MRWLKLALFSLLVSCGGSNSVPDSVIQPEKMETLLFDMLRADQFLADYVFPLDSTVSKPKESVALYNKIFEIHGVTADQFKKSFGYYSDHPALLRIVMDSINKSATYKASLAGKDSLAGKTSDSIKIPVTKDSLLKKKILISQ
jgi:hypothetical protein